MEKIKIDIPTSVYEELIDLCEIGGQIVKFRKKLRYEEMVDFATEYAQHACVIDTESQVAYETHETDKIKDYLTLKYFSNVDVDAADDPMVYAADIMSLIRDSSDWPIRDATDAYNAIAMGEYFLTNTINIYEAYHSIGTRIGKAFSGLLDGGDLVKEIAESRGLSEELVDFLVKKNAPENNVMLFKQFAKKDE